ncbi:hypothetical protein C3Y89_04800 [Rhizobium sp. UPM1132]|nr:hypothetical protein [Rhizobium ruizarguesonis]
MSDLQAIIPVDPSREAISSIRGYDWQRWLTILNWIALEAEDSLWIEWGEDITVGKPGGFRTIQAKSSKASLTLGTKSTMTLVEKALSRPKTVQTLIWTCGSAGREKKGPFDDGAISEWIRHQNKEVDGSALKAFLLANRVASAELKNVIRDANSDDKFAELTSQIRWILGEGPIEEVRNKAIVALERRLTQLSVPVPSLKRDVLGAMLFEFVGQKSIEDDLSNRKLTRPALDKWVHSQIRELQNAVAPENNARLLTQLVEDDFQPDHNTIPFSLPWFVYSAQTIPLIGRQDELDALGLFLEDQRRLAVHLLGGEAGAGKSRLALEFMKNLPAPWIGSYAHVNDLADLHRELPFAGRHVFITIDYASSVPNEVSVFLTNASVIAKRHEIKLRVLLIERDVSEQAEWRKSLSLRFGRGGAEFQNALYGDAMVLSSMANLDVAVLKAWVTASGNPESLVDHLGEARLDTVISLCDGNPLLLGFAAAALVNGDDLFASVTDLLNALLRRQVADPATNGLTGVGQADLLGLVAVATAARFDLSRPKDEEVFRAIRNGSIGHFTVANIDGTQRPLTVGEVRHSTKYPTMRGALALSGEKRTLAIKAAFPDSPTGQLVRATQDLFGPACQLLPDLMGEYFLAQQWKRLNAFEGTLLAGIDDAFLDRQLALAYSFNAIGLYTTLSMLRERPWASDAYVRAVLRFATLVLEDRGEGAELLAHPLTMLLFNSTVKIGKTKPSAATIVTIVSVLERLAGRWPKEMGLQYRLLKAQSNLMHADGSEKDGSVVLRWVARAEKLQKVILDRNADGFAVTYCQILRQAIAFLSKTRDRPESIAALFSRLTSMCRLRDIEGSAEILDATLHAMLSISSDLAQLDSYEPFNREEMRYANVIMATFADNVRALVNHLRTRLTVEQKTLAFKALANCNCVYAKIGNLNAARRCLGELQKNWQLGDADAEKLYYEMIGQGNLIVYGPDRIAPGKIASLCREWLERTSAFLGSNAEVTETFLGLLHVFLQRYGGSIASRDLVSLVSVSLAVELNPQDSRSIEAFYKLANGIFDALVPVRDDAQSWELLTPVIEAAQSEKIGTQIARAVWFMVIPTTEGTNFDILCDRIIMMRKTNVPRVVAHAISTFVVEYYINGGNLISEEIVPRVMINMLLVDDPADRNSELLRQILQIDGEIFRFENRLPRLRA